MLQNFKSTPPYIHTLYLPSYLLTQGPLQLHITATSCGTRCTRPCWLLGGVRTSNLNQARCGVKKVIGDLDAIIKERLPQMFTILFFSILLVLPFILCYLYVIRHSRSATLKKKSGIKLCVVAGSGTHLRRF